MSEELKWCKVFSRVFHLRCYHKKSRVNKKNNRRAIRMMNKAFKKWGCFPLPPEWM